MFQQIGLFPHMTTEDNIGTVPRLLGWPKERIRARAKELLELVGLDPDDDLRRYPASSRAASASASAWRARWRPTSR